MANQEQFIQAIKDGYTFKGEAIKLGRGVLDKQVVEGADVYLPLKTMNRHGLIAGATGTGKTKTLQLISEGLSDASVPVLLLDIYFISKQAGFEARLGNVLQRFASAKKILLPISS